VYVAKKVEVPATKLEPRVPQKVRRRDRCGEATSAGAGHALVEGLAIEDVLLHFAEPKALIQTARPATVGSVGCEPGLRHAAVVQALQGGRHEGARDPAPLPGRAHSHLGDRPHTPLAGCRAS